MTHISATGNLAWTPELREGSNGPYCYASVIVNDRYRDAAGNFHDGEPTRYDLTVVGNQAQNLVRTAQASGNIRVQFSGDLTRQRWTEGERSGINNRVRVDELGVSLRGNVDVTVTKRDTGQQHTRTADRSAAFPSPAAAALTERAAPAAAPQPHPQQAAAEQGAER